MKIEEPINPCFLFIKPKMNPASAKITIDNISSNTGLIFTCL